MADHAATHAVHDPNIGTTGLDHRKMGMWIFLGSDCMFFGSLIGTYLSYKGKSLSGPGPHDVFNIPLTSYSAALLLASSLFMVLALTRLNEDRIKAAAFWLFATAAFGLHFVLNQVYEFATFALDEGLTLSTSLFGSSFFVLTGFHGTHVAIGVTWLLSVFFKVRRYPNSPENEMDVELGGLYWHFVDLVWVAIFTLIYLLPDFK